MKTLKGIFTPKNPLKYRGNPTRIVFRSSWELKIMKYFDLNENIIEWSSEEFWIPYRSPMDNKIHRYFPDFKIKVKDKYGNVTTKVIEIKPKNQTTPPQKKSRITKSYLREVATWGINSEKWKSAVEYCSDRNWEFLILTEKELGIK